MAKKKAAKKAEKKAAKKLQPVSRSNKVTTAKADSKKKKKKKKKGGKGKGPLKNVKKDFVGAEKIADALGFISPSGKLDTSGFETAVANAGARTPETSDALAKAKDMADTAGNRSGETQAELDTLKQRADTAGERSEEMKKILSVMEGGLAGLSAEENAQLRGRATRELQRKEEQLRTEFAQTAARSGIRGRALAGSLEQIGRLGMQETADAEANLLEKNIDIQDKRRAQYADTLSAAETNEFDRGQRAREAYGNALSGAETSEYDRKRQTGLDYRDYLGGLEETERTNKTNALQDLTEINKFNLGQDAVDRATKMAALTGLLGYGTAKQAGKKAYKLAQSSGGSSGGGGGGGGYDNSALVGALGNIIDQQFGAGTSGSI